MPVMLKAEPFFDVVRRIINFLAVTAGVAILVMIGVTVLDIVLRIFKIGIVGAYDIVRVAGVVAVTCALPYVTAVKGHIAIEFFYQSFNRPGRIFLDTFFRLIALGLFALLVYRNILYGAALYASGQVMPTLKIPVFWIPWLIALNFLLILIATAYHLFHPGKEMIKP